MLRTDSLLLCYNPDDEGDIMPQGVNFDQGGPAKMTKELEMKVGGMGMFTSTSKAKIWLEKERFHPGEHIRIHFDIDNTQCKKPVEKFKAKMVRKCFVYSGREGGQNSPIFETQEYIEIKKFNVDFKAKIRDHKVIEFQVPKVDKDIGNVKALHPDLRNITAMMSVSAHNNLFRIQYQLEVYVKHQSKLEFGQGNFVTFDIIVRGQGEPIDLLKQREDAWRR